MSEEENESYRQVEAIRKAGWQQCSVLHPSDEILQLLPAYMEVQTDEWLVIATQTCSLVSCNLNKERLIEVLVARPISKYNPRHGAAKGNENVHFHLPIFGHLEAKGILALDCDLGRRAFLPRARLASIQPEKTWCNLQDVDSFKSWIASYYTRIALPDALVSRLTSTPNGLANSIKEILQQKENNILLSDYVKTFYIRWSPDKEVTDDEIYEIEILVVCTDDAGAQIIERRFLDIVENKNGYLTVCKVLIAAFDVSSADNTVLTDIYGKFRFNQWDELSLPEERLMTIRANDNSK